MRLIGCLHDLLLKVVLAIYGTIRGSSHDFVSMGLNTFLVSTVCCL